MCSQEWPVCHRKHICQIRADASKDLSDGVILAPLLRTGSRLFNPHRPELVSGNSSFGLAAGVLNDVRPFFHVRFHRCFKLLWSRRSWI